MAARFAFLMLCFVFYTSFSRAAGVVEIQQNQLVVDGEKQPQLFGAELQYFRLRGAYGPNVPREQVIALWNKALDHMVEAKMNAISFYIPWDFHEYAEGKFDFDGTVDQDGDGNPDYPSRDLRTFFRLIAEHGIKHIMIRPGPYINAEWGFLGFGAIPKWFHEKYPQSHMVSPTGLKTKLYDYHNPDFLAYTQKWFTTLYNEVLKDYIGPGKPIDFVQIDNETNFMWQPIYNHDYGPSAVARYQQFLQDRYGSVNLLNQAQGSSYKDWSEAKPPVLPGSTVANQDWYRFQDYSMYTYLQKIRAMWENLGVREPEVMFTLAESYNAAPFGILPNYIYRNAPGKTGMMTVNLYPKTFQTLSNALHNEPFKADLDVLAADEANNAYLGHQEEWALGPEIQGGWWGGIPVSDNSRQQTYLSTVGHGLKALFIYYFTEGYNWQVEWAAQQIQPLYQSLLATEKMSGVDQSKLPDSFWNDLQIQVNQKLMLGFDARAIMSKGTLQDQTLYFDSPLDKNADPSAHFQNVKDLGQKVFSTYGNFLASSTNLFDSAALVKDSSSHVPSLDSHIDSLSSQSDGAGALLGYFMNEGMHIRVLHSELSPPDSFRVPKLLVYIDTGSPAPQTIQQLKLAKQSGQSVLSFLSSAAFQAANLTSVIPLPADKSSDKQTLTYYLDNSGHLATKDKQGVVALTFAAPSPIASYDLTATPGCEAILYSGNKVVGYRCKNGNGYFTQISSLIFNDYNTSEFASLGDIANRRTFIRGLQADFGVQPALVIASEAERVSAFARQGPDKSMWITVKTPTQKVQKFNIRVRPENLPTGNDLLSSYVVTDILAGTTQRLTVQQLMQTGFSVNLPAEGSTVFTVVKAGRKIKH